MRRTLLTMCAVYTALLLAACNKIAEVAQESVRQASQAAQHSQSQNDLKRLGLAYHTHVDMNREAPGDWQALQATAQKMSPEDVAALQRLQQAGFSVAWGIHFRDATIGSSNYLLAHNAEALQSGGSVLFLDGAVMHLDAGQVQKAIDLREGRLPPERANEVFMPTQSTAAAPAAPPSQPAATAPADTAARTPATAQPPDPTAPLLRYKFEADQYYGYDITLHIDKPDFVETHKLHAMYRVSEVREDRFWLVCYGHQDVDVERKPGSDVISPGGLNRTPSPARMQIDPHGKLFNSSNTTPLPYAIGELETAALPPLPPQQQRQWSTEDRFRISESRSPAGFVVGGGNSSEAQERVNYSIASVQGDLVWVNKKHDVKTDDQYNTLGDLHLTGDGRFAFNRSKGRIESLSMTYTCRMTEAGKPITVTAKLTCRPMSDSKLKQLAGEQEQRYAEQAAQVEREAAEEEAREAERKARQAAANAAAIDQPVVEYRTWSDASGKFQIEAALISVQDGQATLRRKDGQIVRVPLERLAAADRQFVESVRGTGLTTTGTAVPSYQPPGPAVASVSGTPVDTELVGGDGGFKFRFAGDKPLLGVRYELGSWAGQEAVGKMEAVFDRDSSDSRGRKHAIARPGYAVGGLLVDAAEYVNAMQLVFMRQNPDGSLDTTDRYNSPWIGKPTGKSPVPVGGTGQPVVGIHGRAGLITDAVGLVLMK